MPEHHAACTGCMHEVRMHEVLMHRGGVSTANSAWSCPLAGSALCSSAAPACHMLGP